MENEEDFAFWDLQLDTIEQESFVGGNDDAFENIFASFDGYDAMDKFTFEMDDANNNSISLYDDTQSLIMTNSSSPLVGNSEEEEEIVIVTSPKKRAIIFHDETQGPAKRARTDARHVSAMESSRKDGETALKHSPIVETDINRIIADFMIHTARTHTLHPSPFAKKLMTTWLSDGMSASIQSTATAQLRFMHRWAHWALLACQLVLTRNTRTPGSLYVSRHVQRNSYYYAYFDDTAAGPYALHNEKSPYSPVLLFLTHSIVFDCVTKTHPFLATLITTAPTRQRSKKHDRYHYIGGEIDRCVLPDISGQPDAAISNDLQTQLFNAFIMTITQRQTSPFIFWSPMGESLFYTMNNDPSVILLSLISQLAHVKEQIDVVEWSASEKIDFYINTPTGPELCAQSMFQLSVRRVVTHSVMWTARLYLLDTWIDPSVIWQSLLFQDKIHDPGTLGQLFDSDWMLQSLEKPAADNHIVNFARQHSKTPNTYVLPGLTAFLDYLQLPLVKFKNRNVLECMIRIGDAMSAGDVPHFMLLNMVVDQLHDARALETIVYAI